jgi:hypothetical protein
MIYPQLDTILNKTARSSSQWLPAKPHKKTLKEKLQHKLRKLPGLRSLAR